MAPRRKRRRDDIRAPATELSADLLLEIVARTDFITLIRCAALCKHLRRDILSPPFIRRVRRQQAAPSILARFCTHTTNIPLTLVHPATLAASSFCYDYLSPFMSRNAGKDVLDPTSYLVTSRGGLALLKAKGGHRYNGCFDMCVYEPMTGHRTFISELPYTDISISNVHHYVLLTAADGIDCSFMLLSMTFNRSRIKVQTATSSGTWGPLTSATHRDSTLWSICPNNDPAVLRGGVVHWLRYTGDQIVTYDVRTGTPGRVKLSVIKPNAMQLHLATSPDRNLLKLLAIDLFSISIWLQLPTDKTGDGGDGWSLENVINIEEKLRLFYPHIPIGGGGPNIIIEFDGFGNTSDDMVLLETRYKQGCIILDLKTKEMHWTKWSSAFGFLEFDLPSQPQAMKVFS